MENFIIFLIIVVIAIVRAIAAAAQKKEEEGPEKTVWSEEEWEEWTPTSPSAPPPPPPSDGTAKELRLPELKRAVAESRQEPVRPQPAGLTPRRQRQPSASPAPSPPPPPKKIRGETPMPDVRKPMPEIGTSMRDLGTPLEAEAVMGAAVEQRTREMLRRSMRAAMPVRMKLARPGRIRRRPPIRISATGRRRIQEAIVLSEVVGRPRAFDL